MIHETKGFELTKEIASKYRYACRLLDSEFNHLGDFFVKDLENVVPTAKRLFGERANNTECTVYSIVNEIQVSAYAEEIFKIEPFITKDQQKQFKEAYNNHFAGKNWGGWNMSKAPALGVGYQLLQYENGKGQICDVIKFDQKVDLEGKRFSGKTFVLSDAKPDHRVDGFWHKEPPETITRACKGCGNRYPVKETGRWYSTNYCMECANERETEIFETFREMKAQKGDTPQNRDYWLHWAQHHGGGNNLSHERLHELWEQA